jgi:hypothetical protein
MLILQIILITSNTYYFMKEFNMTFFNQYISGYVGHLGVINNSLHLTIKAN